MQARRILDLNIDEDPIKAIYQTENEGGISNQHANSFCLSSESRVDERIGRVNERRRRRRSGHCLSATTSRF